MNRYRRDQQKSNRLAGGKHTGALHEEGKRCLVCRPESPGRQPESPRTVPASHPSSITEFLAQAVSLTQNRKRQGVSQGRYRFSRH